MSMMISWFLNLLADSSMGRISIQTVHRSYYKHIQILDFLIAENDSRFDDATSLMINITELMHAFVSFPKGYLCIIASPDIPHHE